MGGMDQPQKMRVVQVPMLDTGLGREAGYADDAQLIAAYEAQQAEVDALLTPRARSRFDSAERELERRLLGR